MTWIVWAIIIAVVLESAAISYWSVVGHVRVYGPMDAVINLVFAPLFIWGIVSLATQ